MKDNEKPHGKCGRTFFLTNDKKTRKLTIRNNARLGEAWAGKVCALAGLGLGGQVSVIVSKSRLSASGRKRPARASARDPHWTEKRDKLVLLFEKPSITI